jgi:hypothetical protein
LPPVRLALGSHGQHRYFGWSATNDDEFGTL